MQVFEETYRWNFEEGSCDINRIYGVNDARSKIDGSDIEKYTLKST